MAHDAPTIANNLALVVQRIVRDDAAHVSEITYAVDDIAAVGAQSLADQLQEAWTDAWAPQFDSAATSLPCIVRLGDGTNVPAEAIAAGAAVPGTATSKTLPPNVAMLVKKNTGLGGRKNRGRIFFPYLMAEADVAENGFLSDAQTAAFQGIADAWLTDLATNNFPMVIANRTLVLTPPDTRPHVTAITMGHIVGHLIVENLVATQRRRLGR